VIGWGLTSYWLPWIPEINNCQDLNRKYFDTMFRVLLREQKKLIPGVISSAQRGFATQADHGGRVRVLFITLFTF